MQFFFHYHLNFSLLFDYLLWLGSCSLARIHAVLLDDFPCKFFFFESFSHYCPYLLVHRSENKVSAKLPCLSNFHLLIAVASIKFMKFLEHRASWQHLLQVVLFFSLPFFEDFSVRSKYCSSTLLKNKGSSTRKFYFSTNAIKSTKLSFLLLHFLIANTFWLHLPPICCGSSAIIKQRISGESRALQVWLHVTLWHFSRKLWNNLNDDASHAFIVGHFLISSLSVANTFSRSLYLILNNSRAFLYPSDKGCCIQCLINSFASLLVYLTDLVSRHLGFSNLFSSLTISLSIFIEKWYSRGSLDKK